MFNSPRPGQPYTALGASTTTGLGASFIDDNPLAGSIYDDPWSSNPSPAPTPMPNGSLFTSAIADATVPVIYDAAFTAVDPHNTGETSVNSLSRMLSTSGLPAATIDKIVNLVSNRPRVSKLEFFVALALVALAQAGQEISIEHVAALSFQNTLPEPVLDFSRLPPLTSSFVPANYRQASLDRTSMSSYNPWNTNLRPSGPPANSLEPPRTMPVNGASSNFTGSGLPVGWWKKQETIRVNVLGLQGFILNRYMVYEIASDRGPPVNRRYSEFVFLWDCLLRRYPFRLFPPLPPKRLGPDEHFLEQRRRGLSRCLNFIVNHPIIKEDALLAVFLTEPSFEEWRKTNSVSLEEESKSNHVDRFEEMMIPSDLEDKIATIQSRLNSLIEHWQRICILTERIIRRREAAASDLSRTTNTLRALIEVNERCWKADECDLSNGVNLGIERVAEHAQVHSEIEETRTRAFYDTTLEGLKAQRDLYLATRELFVRFERMSIDQVERLKKRVDANSLKLNGIRAAQKDGWKEEVERLTILIEKDQTTIAAQLSRRTFIRASMWHELRVVLHNRENGLLTHVVRTLVREEHLCAERVLKNWTSLEERLDEMPYE